MTRALRAIAAGVFAALAGCANPPQSISEMDATELRTVEAPADATYSAATHALTDAGYILWTHDADAGILTGEKRVDPGVAPNAAFVLFTAIFARQPTELPPEFQAVCVQVRPDGPARSSVRLRAYRDGEALRDPDTVQELWTLISREALRHAPPPSAPPAATPTANPSTPR